MGVEKVEGSTARYGSNREAAPRARSTIRCATSVSLRDQARSLNGNTPHPLGLTVVRGAEDPGWGAGGPWLGCWGTLAGVLGGPGWGAGWGSTRTFDGHLTDI
eukprot:131068-Prorocentrum_minimum.AAC.1